MYNIIIIYVSSNYKIPQMIIINFLHLMLEVCFSFILYLQIGQFI